MSIYTAGHLRTTDSLPRGVFFACPTFYGTQQFPQNLVTGEVGTLSNGDFDYESTIYGTVAKANASTSPHATFDIAIPSGTALSDWSISVIAKMDAASTDYSALAAVHGGDFWKVAIEARFVSGTSYRLAIQNSLSRSTYVADVGGSWVHLIGRFTDPARELFVDGVEQASTGSPLGGPGTTFDRVDILGLGSDGAAYPVADVLIANVAWTDEEIATLVASPWAHYEIAPAHTPVGGTRSITPAKPERTVIPG